MTEWLSAQEAGILACPWCCFADKNLRAARRRCPRMGWLVFLLLAASPLTARAQEPTPKGEKLSAEQRQTLLAERDRFVTEAEARDDEPLSDSAGGPRPPGAIPRQVVERFLRVDNEYYFPDRTLAFIDHGTKLTSRTNNAEVVRSLVAIAKVLVLEPAVVFRG